MQQSNSQQIEQAKVFLAQKHRLLIDGEWREPKSGDYFEIFDPATGEVISHAAAAGREDVNAAVKAAKRAFKAGEWTGLKPAQRRHILNAIADRLEAHAAELGYLECRDNGKSFLNAVALDAASAAGSFRYYAGWCDKIHGTSNQISAPGENHAFTLREPVGVVALIVPWNFPMGLTAMKLAPALAAGCTCILKPAEETSLTALRMGQLLLDAGVPAGVVNVVTGLGHIAGAALAEHGDVAKVAFTGSTEVGKKIIQSAAGNLKKLSLELGGKAPSIILPDAALHKAIKASAAGGFYNSGQNCMALSQLFAHEDVYDRVVAGVCDYARSLKVGPGMEEDTQMGPLISYEHMKRVLDYIAIGKSEGAQIAAGGNRIERGGYFVEPTVFTGCTPSMRIVREEIFGPVVAVIKYKDINDVIDQVNESEYGLSAAVWTADLSMAHRLAKALRVGCIGLNSANAADRDLPLGGFRQSGWGRENAFEGLSLYLETKAIVVGWEA